MAVTTTYFWNKIQNIDISPSNIALDVTSLANGGFAAMGEEFGHIDGNLFNSSLGGAGNFFEITGTNGAIDQLANGNLVVASQDANSILFRIVSSVTGNDIVATTDLGDSDSSNADVAALTGGRFVIVATDEFAEIGGDSDIDVYVRNADGTAVASFSIDVSLIRDTNPRVAGLDDGNFAVVWERDNGGDTEIWYAIYAPSGVSIKAPTLLDDVQAINRNPDIVAIDGGFGIVYEDTDWDGDVDITLARFNSTGLLLGYTKVSAGADVTSDETPSITRLSNGMLAVAWGENFTPGNATDTRVALLNASGSSVLATQYVTASENVTDDVGSISLAGYGAGRLAVFHSNLTDFDVDGEALSAVRLSESDAASDTITGDEIDDWMLGNGGDDILNGMGGEDRLLGGTGVNTLSGGDGNDILVVETGSDGTHVLGGTGFDSLTVSGNVISLGTISSIEALSFGFFSTLSLTGSQFATGLATNTGIIGPISMGGNEGNLIVNMTTGVNFVSKFMSSSGVNVTVNGTIGTDLFKLGNFRHTVIAGDGTDQIKGGTAIDTINGGIGGDKINGAAGADILTGGAGNDVFKYAAAIDSGLGAARDRITDYAIGADRLNFARIDTNAGIAGDQAFGFIGTASFGGIGVAQIRYMNSGADLLVQADVDGNGTADMEILLQGLSGGTLTAADFVL